MFKKSAEVELPYSLRNGDTKNLATSCYEFTGSIEDYLVIRNRELSNGAFVRVASFCFAQPLNMVRCDCHAQLELSLEAIASRPNSVLIYCLSEDGRGQGPLEHINATKRMMDDGVHTSDALPDVRNYEHVAEILRELGLSRFNLYTNNPDKEEALRELGFEIEAIPIEVAVNEQYRWLLEQKLERGHRLRIDGGEHVGK